jgi:purine-nucleoside/S-methyl-5'-thioadenosine phosphorylase / adenosine deaminase
MAMSTTAAKKKAPVPRRAERFSAPWELRRVAGLQVLEAPAFERLDWIVHGFSTRSGGASNPAGTNRGNNRGAHRKGGGTLNLGFCDWDSREHLAHNRREFFHAIGGDKFRIITLRQRHSDLVQRVVAQASREAEPPQGDALFTREAGVVLCVQTADCVPILLADTKKRVIAAIHAGWRGTLRRIAAKTLGRMQMEFGTRPEDVVAALGPCIGRCCYEVGSDVVREFHAQFPNAREWFDGPFDALASGENDPNWLPWLTMMPPGHPPPSPRVHLDLIAANHAILAEAGVPARQISSSGYCTACRTDLFFSYRREGATGRLMTAIGIRKD